MNTYSIKESLKNSILTNPTKIFDIVNENGEILVIQSVKTGKKFVIDCVSKTVQHELTNPFIVDVNFIHEVSDLKILMYNIMGSKETLI